jgi:short-subunit dehydrogenase
MNIEGRWALVTGASSGIGRDIARELAARGCHCVVLARRADRLEDLAFELRDRHSIQVEVEVCDLLSDGAIAALHEGLRSRGRQVDVLVNNAGVGRHGTFIEQELDGLLTMMRLNMLALVELTHRFAGDMAGRGYGHVLNVASTGGLNPVPSYAVYGATKAFVVSLSEAVSLELRARGVRVTCAMPGPASTEFLERSGQTPTLYHRLSNMPSRAVARDCVRAMIRGRSSVVVGWSNWISMVIAKFLPRRLMAWISWQMMRND